MVGFSLVWRPVVLPNSPRAQKVNRRKLGQVAEAAGDRLLLKTLHGAA